MSQTNQCTCTDPKSMLHLCTACQIEYCAILDAQLSDPLEEMLATAHWDKREPWEPELEHARRRPGRVILPERAA